MRPVDRAGIAKYLVKFRCVHMRELAFSNRDLGDRIGNFSHRNTIAWLPGCFCFSFQVSMPFKVVYGMPFALSAVFFISLVSHLAAVIQLRKLIKL